MSGGAAFLGLDLAWSPRNPSGAALLREDGTLHDWSSPLGDDDDILRWVVERLEPTTVIGIDMPTIVPNEAGMRPCEREVNAAFRRFEAGTHPANRALFRAMDPLDSSGTGRARRLLDALEAYGVRETLDLEPKAAGRFAFEVFPHAAHVRLFGLARTWKYKKKTARAWPDVLAAWERYRAALATLRDADPPLMLPADLPARVDVRGYKRWDDTLDAVTCAYVAAMLWRWGTRGTDPLVVFGDLATGYIAIPALPHHRRPGVEESAPCAEDSIA